MERFFDRCRRLLQKNSKAKKAARARAPSVHPRTIASVLELLLLPGPVLEELARELVCDAAAVDAEEATGEDAGAAV